MEAGDGAEFGEACPEGSKIGEGEAALAQDGVGQLDRLDETLEALRKAKAARESPVSSRKKS